MRRCVLGWAALAAAAACGAWAADAPSAPQKKDTERATVIQTGGGTDVRILSREIETTAPAEKRKAGGEAVADTAPRKARVVVMPAVYAQDVRSRLERELQEKFGLSDPTMLENPGYTSFLVDALVNSHKLDVLEREDLKSVLKEIDFGESDYADAAKVVRIGRALNADYVVLPEIRYFFVTSEQKEVPYIGQTREKVKAKLATNVRVVDVATTRISSSNIGAVEDDFRFKDNAGPRAQQLRDFISSVYGQSGRAEAAQIVDTAYPIRVVAVSAGEVALNRGEGAIAVGEVLNVYQPGEMMVDPDTHETLGYHEARVGQIRVTEVNERTARAAVVEGDGSIARLAICRREKAAESSAPASPAPKID